MKELMLCELFRTDVAAVPADKKKMEFTTTATIRNIIFDPLSDDFVLLFVEDNIDEGSAFISKDSIPMESEWASFIDKTVKLKGFAVPPIYKDDKPILFIYSLEEV